MPGSVVNLSILGSRFPDPVIVDTNLLVERLLVPFIGAPSSSLPVFVNALRANQFFHDLKISNGTGIVTPTAFNEFVHIAIKFKYKHERLRLGTSAQQVYGRPITSWLDLYKQDATILQQFLPNLEHLRQLFIASGLLFLAPDALGSVTSGRTYDEELVHLVGTYGLDSNDALILMEAQRCGVTNIVSLDLDMQRAQADFDIFTWL